jgi:hypothetical protein
VVVRSFKRDETTAVPGQTICCAFGTKYQELGSANESREFLIEGKGCHLTSSLSFELKLDVIGVLAVHKESVVPQIKSGTVAVHQDATSCIFLVSVNNAPLFALSTSRTPRSMP